MNGFNDFNLAGIFCLLVGGLTLAGFPSAVKVEDSHMEATAFYGSNPFVRKNQEIRKYQKAIGIFWLLTGTTFQVIGFMTTKITPFWINPGLEVIGFIIITAGILKTTPVLVYKISSRKWRTPIIETYRKVLENAEVVLKNNGLYQNEIGRKDLTIPTGAIEERLASVTKRLNLIGQLIDIPRMENESDEKYFERLRPFFVKDSNKE